MKAKATVFVDCFTNGILGPDVETAGIVKDGGYIVAHTAPGCWGPMITPSLRGGHEVTRPVLVEGAQIGDAIAIRIQSITVASEVAASGTDSPIEGRYSGDPFVADHCAVCGKTYPETVLEGIGQDAVRCAACDAPASAFKMTSGYTMAFDEARTIGITLDRKCAERAAANAESYMAVPDASCQHPIVTYAPCDLPGIPSRVRPFIGQLGTTPALAFPDSHNAGDFGQALIGAPHAYAKTRQELEARTDGHMDINKVREGAVVICPVKIPGGGVYVGDVHAMQGDGEVAGHTCDIAAQVTLKVQIIKGLHITGPIILPLPEDIPYLARPFCNHEYMHAKRLADKWASVEPEQSLPLCFVGSGATINDAAGNAFDRAAQLLNMRIEEVKNRCTINGAVQIGRLPGVVTATFLVPKAILMRERLYSIAAEMYDCCFHLISG